MAVPLPRIWSKAIGILPRAIPPGLLLEKLTLTNHDEGRLCFQPALLQCANEVIVDVDWLCSVHTQHPPSLDALVDMLTAGHWSRLELKATEIKSRTPTGMWKEG
ncbi:hypothetical protein WJX72_000354 [[Myrmecia] bisecta]|uniref:Uncharacterized protein n=1 Tax=[Myrmecia] bisecta TaxID=41462 RepID=A0AAW1QBC8_9CHLO